MCKMRLVPLNRDLCAAAKVGPRSDRSRTQVGPSHPIKTVVGRGVGPLHFTKTEGWDKVGLRWDRGGTAPMIWDQRGTGVGPSHPIKTVVGPRWDRGWNRGWDRGGPEVGPSHPIETVVGREVGPSHFIKTDGWD